MIRQLDDKTMVSGQLTVIIGNANFSPHRPASQLLRIISYTFVLFRF